MKNKKIIIATTVAIISSTLFLSGCGKSLESEKKVDKNIEESQIKQNEIKEIQVKIEAIEKNLKDPYMILVNKDNRIDSTFKSVELIKSEIPFQPHIETRHLDKTVADAAKKMFDDAKKEGINLLGASGYRAYEIQNRMYNDKVKKVGQAKAEEYLAPPGASEHQTGYALDISSSEYSRLDEGFEKTKAFKWLHENSKNYGFILRYDKSKEDITKYKYEPWHYRYVGIENAKKIMDSGLCFEEYVSNVKEELEELKRTLNGIEQ